MRFLIFAIFLLTPIFAQTEEFYPEQDCPSRTPMVIAGAVIGAAVVYELVTPNLNQPNGITFLTSVGVGALSGGFAGAAIAQGRCRSHVALGLSGVQFCYDF